MGWQDAPVVDSSAGAEAWKSAPVVNAAPMTREQMFAQIPGQVRPPEPQVNEPGMLEHLAGAPGAALGALSGMVAAPVAQVAGIGGTLASGKYGTPDGIKAGEETQRKVQEALTYQPRTQAGQNQLKSLGSFIERSGIGAIPLPELNALARSAPAAARAIQDAGGLGSAKVQQALKTAFAPKNEGPLAGSVGAEKTAAETLRRQRAESLSMPGLTKGQAQRTFEQQQFERETAKSEVGAPLREHYSDQNEAILKKFDQWVDQTGSEAPDLRTVGKVVDATLVTKAKQAKARIKDAYTKADESPEALTPIDHKALRDYISQQGPTVREKLAPILSAVEDQIKLNDPKGTGSITLKQAEDLRKIINKNAAPGSPDMVHGIEMKKLIDASTEGKGGALYKTARDLRSAYSREFSDKATISKLLRNKPGTTDRAVALEDIHKHSILDGSMDDVREIKRTLQTAGPDGAQAWKELQGATINHLKEIATKSVQTDSRGNRVISPAAFDKSIKSLDADGRLDVIFGKKGAEQLRDLNQHILDVYTSPPGTVNTSNTTSALMRVLDKIGSPVIVGIDKVISSTTGIPAPVGGTLKYLGGKIEQAKTAKKVAEALK